MSCAVIFSTSRAMQAVTSAISNQGPSIASATEIFRSCFCSRDSTIDFLARSSPCEIVAPTHLGEMLKAFTERWDTEGLSSVQIKREGLIWERFFTRAGDSSSKVVGMSFQRSNPNLTYRVEIKGNDADQLSTICREVFRNTGDGALVEEAGRAVKEREMEILDASFQTKRQESKALGLPIKKKILIATRANFNSAAFSMPVVMDTTARFPTYFTKNEETFQFSFIDPLMPHYFALAPTITKMQQIVNCGGICVVQDFSEHLPHARE